MNYVILPCATTCRRELATRILIATLATFSTSCLHDLNPNPIVSSANPNDSPDEEQEPLPAQLGKPLPELRFNGNYLGDVLDFMRDITGKNIQTDWPALEKAGITRDTPITVKLKNVDANAALTAIMKCAGTGPVKAGYKFENGVIAISVGPGYDSTQRFDK
jgi:hypothetical protein